MDWLPADWPDRLAGLAGRIDLLAELEAAAHSRLGHYFEILYACLLQELLGWELLARNIPVRKEGRTLGELDVLVRNPVSGEVEHHEVAVKFYLGHAERDGGEPRWYGPNSRDRLDLKVRRLLDHQATLSQLPATRSVLAKRGLPLPSCSRVWMPGYLFHPAAGVLSPPEDVSAEHLRGRWWQASAVAADQLEHAVILGKPDWLGPWRQAVAPDADHALAAARRIAGGAPPRLFARLEQEPGSGWWCEAERFFLVPDDWPSPASR